MTEYDKMFRPSLYYDYLWNDVKSTNEVWRSEMPTLLKTIETSEGASIKLWRNDPLKIEKVIFNDPATIVFWSDNTKTVVTRQNDEPFDREKGLAMAIAKRAFGNKGNYYNVFKRFLEEEK